MSTSPKVALRPVALELRCASVPFVASALRAPSVACVASPVASVAFERPHQVLAVALLRARKLRQAEQSQRIARRRSVDVASRVSGSVPGSASVPGSVASRCLH